LTFKAKEEVVLPIKKGGHQAPEDFPISLFPDFLGCDGEDFHKEAEVEVHFSLLYNVEEVEVMILENSKVAPALRAEGALED
jgi:hypothetical protein